jgi:uncharacterized protein YbjT (DUF2867 family)
VTAKIEYPMNEPEMTMTLPILVTGGTGTLGSLLVPRLLAAGRPVRVLSRHPHQPGDGAKYVTGDLATGEGVAAAVDGVETVAHLAGSAKGDDDKARSLVQAASAAGVQHLVYISVVGADRVPVLSPMDRAMFGYYAAKWAAEQVIAGSGLPWTTLRATQFHDLVFTMVQQLAKLPVMPVPAGLRFQPVDAAAVADRLAELTLGTPSGLVPDVAGPRVYGLDQLLRSYLRASRRRRLRMPIRVPGRAARALRDGANLAPAHGTGRTWEDFLAERLRPATTTHPSLR